MEVGCPTTYIGLVMISVCVQFLHLFSNANLFSPMPQPNGDRHEFGFCNCETVV